MRRTWCAYGGSSHQVSWGDTSPCLNVDCSRRVPNDGDGPDGRNGDQPIGTLVRGNVVRETGIYERQGTMWNQALSAETTLQGNIFFNCDRASVNVNDGFGGGGDSAPRLGPGPLLVALQSRGRCAAGNLIAGNLVFNTGRGANKDEGSFNSWCAYILPSALPAACPEDPEALGGGTGTEPRTSRRCGTGRLLRYRLGITSQAISSWQTITRLLQLTTWASASTPSRTLRHQQHGGE